jgi:hypothetical protein
MLFSPLAVLHMADLLAKTACNADCAFILLQIKE